jgi:hypothetical protein
VEVSVTATATSTIIESDRTHWRVMKLRTPAARPWQLWLCAGEAMALKAERSSFEFIIQVLRTRLRNWDELTAADLLDLS